MKLKIDSDKRIQDTEVLSN